MKRYRWKDNHDGPVDVPLDDSVGNGAPEVKPMVNLELNELLLERAGLATRKSSVMAELTTIKARIGGAGRLPDKQYRELLQRKARLVGDLATLEARFATIKAELRRLDHEEHESWKQRNGSAHSPDVLLPVVDALRSLHAKYQNFASDPTRVSSMRLMAAEVTKELDCILADLNSRQREKIRRG